jgi:SagB-type dehydrogenase family enzyme
MDHARTATQTAFMCSRLDDPRRLDFRAGLLDAYRRRGGADDLVEISHDLTNLRRADGAAMLDSISFFLHPSMQAVLHTHDRQYPLQPLIRLPTPAIPNVAFAELVRGRRSCRRFGEGRLSSAQMSAMLFATLGETGRLSVPGEDGQPVAVSLRSIPSGGGLHPTAIFVATLRPGDLAPGIYHYDVPEHALELVKPLTAADIATLLTAFPVHPEVVDLGLASAICFITTKFWRSRGKYGPRGYRYCLQEAGCACQNLGLTAVALGLAHIVIGGFYDDEVHACLELDGVDHAVVTAIAVGPPPRQTGAEPHVGF